MTFSFFIKFFLQVLSI